MTDNEIVKALECCKKDDCDNCPNDFCQENLDEAAFDLVNRQKAEIERWQLENSELQHEILSCKAKAVKEFAARLKTELIAGGIYPVFVKNSIDNLAKEMVGDTPCEQE